MNASALAPGVAPDYFGAPERIAATRRSQEIARLRHYYLGTQYDGRPDWFTGKGKGGEVVPLRERKPCIVYPLPKAACNQATRFTFGEGRFPQIAVPETDSDDATTTVSGDEGKVLTKYLANVIESARLKSAMRRLLRVGLSQRTAVAVLGVRRGRFTVDMPRPQDCFPRFIDDDPEGDVASMVWCYAFEKEVERGQAIVTETHLFRRDYTETEIVFYQDALVVPGKAVEWVRDETRTTPHELGFCPVLWIRNLPAEDCQDIDGMALFEGLEDEFDALNFALSQRHRGIVYFGTPQAYETGVGEDEQPGAVARTERAAKTTTDARAAAKDPYQKAAGGAARKTAPDQIWSYRSSDAKPGIIETTGVAFEVASKHVLDVRARILEAIDVVLLDPMTVAGKGELSAKALAMMYAPLLALVDELRDCWWSTGLARLLSMVLRITVALGGRGILVPQAGAVAKLCSRFLVAFEGVTLWVPPKMLPSWGSYFSPTNAEVGELVAATCAAKEGGLIKDATARRNVAGCFGEGETDDDDDAPESDRRPRAGGRDDGYGGHMSPLHMKVRDDARRIVLPEAFLAKLGRVRLGQLDVHTVYAVDGAAVRGLDTCFADSGNPSFYVYIPDGELWIDRRLAENPADLAATALHEAIECAVGADGEVEHDDADQAAHAAEEVARKMLAALPAPSGPASALQLAAAWLPSLLPFAEALAADEEEDEAAPGFTSATPAPTPKRPAPGAQQAPPSGGAQD
jgi:hypothetical protein